MIVTIAKCLSDLFLKSLAIVKIQVWVAIKIMTITFTFVI